MKNKILWMLGLLSVSIVSCQKEISIKQQPYQEKVSIQCLLTPGANPKLYLYRTVPYLTGARTLKDLFIRDATVIITSSSGADTLGIDSVYEYYQCNYQYYYTSNAPTVANAGYGLSIKWNGREYTATTVTNQPIAQIGSIYYTPNFKDIYGKHEGIIYKFKDEAGSQNYYRYEMTRLADSSVYYGEKVRSPCLAGGSVRVEELGRSIYSDENQDGQELSFVIEPAYTHKQGDEVYLRLQTCDKNIYDFCTQLDKQKLASLNLFVEPVFLEEGQFQGAFGVFGSYNVSDSVLFVYPE